MKKYLYNGLLSKTSLFITPLAAISIISIFGNVDNFHTWFADILLFFKALQQFVFIPFSYLPIQISEFLKNLIFVSLMIVFTVYHQCWMFKVNNALCIRMIEKINYEIKYNLRLINISEHIYSQILLMGSFMSASFILGLYSTIELNNVDLISFVLSSVLLLLMMVGLVAVLIILFFGCFIFPLIFIQLEDHLNTDLSIDLSSINSKDTLFYLSKIRLLLKVHRYEILININLIGLFILVFLAIFKVR